MKEAVTEAVTDKVLVAERKLAQVCIHCGEDFGDPFGWYTNATCNTCDQELPESILEEYMRYTTIYSKYGNLL